MHRNANGAGLLGNVAADRLTYPPGGVGAEFKAARRVKLGDGAQQTQVAFLDQVKKREAAAKIAVGNIHHKGKVGANQRLVGFLSPPVDGIQLMSQVLPADGILIELDGWQVLALLNYRILFAPQFLP